MEGDREQEILDAALEVLGEVGYDRLTMDAVASRAKASKATLYRRWTNKLTLVIDALVAQKAAPEPADTGSLRGDLEAAYCGFGGLTDPETVIRFTSVLTAIGRDPEFAHAYRTQVLGPEDRAHAGDLRACPGPRRAARRHRHHPDRPGPAGHRPAPLLHAR